MLFFFFNVIGDHRDLRVLTHSFPTRRSSDRARRGDRSPTAVRGKLRDKGRAGFRARGRQCEAKVPVSYDPAIITLSVVIAIQGSYVSLTLARRLASLGLDPFGDDPGGRSAARRKALLAASALSLGVGIWAMHFLGLLAVQLPVAVTDRKSTRLNSSH